MLDHAVMRVPVVDLDMEAAFPTMAGCSFPRHGIASNSLDRLIIPPVIEDSKSGGPIPRTPAPVFPAADAASKWPYWWTEERYSMYTPHIIGVTVW